MSLDSRENLDGIKKCVSAIEKSWSRSRLLVFVSTSMSRLKSLDRGREIHWDLKNLAFLDSLSWSRLRSVRIFAFSRQNFSIRRDFSSFSDSKGLDNVKISQQMLLRLDKSRQSGCVSTISTKISPMSWLKSLDFKNLDQEKKNLVSTLRTVSISISIRLDCWDPQAELFL